MTRAGRQRLWIVLTALLIVLLSFFAEEPEDPDATYSPSTFHAGKGGARALYLAAQDLGFDVQPWMHPIAELDEHDIQVLVLLAPKTPLVASEAKALASWVEEEDDRVLVYVPGSSPLNDLAELSEDEPAHDELLQELNVELTRHRGRDGTPLTPADTTTRWIRDLFEGLEEPLPGVPTRYEVEDDAVEVTILLEDADHRPAALAMDRLGGVIVLFGDTRDLTNRHLDGSEHALVFLRSLRALAGERTIHFDEYHHGFVAGDGLLAATWSWLTRERLGWALLGLSALGLVSLVTAGLRLGAQIPPDPPPGRSSLEHVQALASAYREVHADRRVRALLVEGLRLDLGERASETLDELAASDLPVAEDANRVRTAKDPGASADLVQLAASIDRLYAEAHVTRTDRSRP